jgi:hypothetical protein
MSTSGTATIRSMHDAAPGWPPYVALVAVWLATRGVAVVTTDMTPWMLNDLHIYQSWLTALRHFAFPSGDPTWQYPPGIGPVFVATDLLPIPFTWAFTLVMLAFDAAILAALMAAHARRPEASWRGIWLWAVAGIVVGPIMVTRFDLVPTLFAVLSVLLVGRPAMSGVSAGMGFMVKLWPALMLLSLPRAGARRGIVAFAVTVVTVATLFAVAFDGSLSFIGNQRARGLQVESVGALPYVVYSWLGHAVAFGLEYGSIQVLMNGTEIVGALMTVLGLAALALIAWWRLSGRLESVPAGDVALTLMLVSVASSRVYSPQFNVWLVGMASVALLSRATRLGLVALLVVAVSIVTQVVYPWSATELVTGDTRGVGAQTVRIVGLLAATGLALWRIRARRPAGV